MTPVVERPAQSILFICTGNTFRSVVAEYALKARLAPASPYLVGSAGIEAVPQPIPSLIRDRLREKGVDPVAHMQRKLTRELLERVDLPVAIALDHQEHIRQHFQREAFLFNQVCYQREEPILDVHEAIKGWQDDPAAVRAYVLSLIDYIWDAMPAFLARIPALLPPHPGRK